MNYSEVSRDVTFKADNLEAQSATDLEAQSDDDIKVLMLCRRASKLHFQMNLFPFLLIKERMVPSFDMPHMRWQQRLAVIIAMFVVLALPLGYAHTLMPYPCKARTVLERQIHSDAYRFAKEILNDTSHTGLAKVVEYGTGCDMQDYMRDLHGGFYVGAVVVATSLLLTLLMSAVTNILSSYECHRMRATLWRPLLMFWYMWIEPQASKLKFSNDAQLFPGLYTPTSVVICWVYILIASELIFLGINSGNAFTGAICAYTLAQLFLRVSNHVLGGSDEVIAVMDGIISHWVPDRQQGRCSLIERSGGKVRTVMDKLHKATALRKVTCALSKDDLDDLERLAPIREQHRKLNPNLDQRLGDDNSPSAVGIITKFYIHDTHQFVDLTAGTVKVLAATGEADWKW